MITIFPIFVLILIWIGLFLFDEILLEGIVDQMVTVSKLGENILYLNLIYTYRTHRDTLNRGLRGSVD